MLPCVVSEPLIASRAAVGRLILAGAAAALNWNWGFLKLARYSPVGAAAIELGRDNRALYPGGAPARASGTSYISTMVRGFERLFGGGGTETRGNYAFGAKTAGGAIGRGVSRGSVLVGVGVESYEAGRAVGAVQVCL